MIVIEVSPQLCADQKVQWPGVFLLSNGTLHHVTPVQTDSKSARVDNVKAYLSALGQTAVAVITTDEYQSLGGTLVPN